MSAEEPRLITGYVPSIALSIIASLTFLLLFMAFTYRFWKTRSHRWMLCLTIGTFFMTVGFFVRIGMTSRPGSLMVYIISSMYTLLPPCAFLAHLYLLLPRLATYLAAEDCLYLHPRLIARTFIWIDVAVFAIQGGGGGLSASRDATLGNIGAKITLVGLILQCVSFGAFCVLSVLFAIRLRQRQPLKWSAGTEDQPRTWLNDWRVVYYALLANCVLFLIRCCFRVAEFSEGYSGKLRTTEWYIYVFDTLPIALSIAMWAVVWPPAYLGSAGGVSAPVGMSGSGSDEENGVAVLSLDGKVGSSGVHIGEK